MITKLPLGIPAVALSTEIEAEQIATSRPAESGTGWSPHSCYGSSSSIDFNWGSRCREVDKALVKRPFHPGDPILSQRQETDPPQNGLDGNDRFQEHSSSQVKRKVPCATRGSDACFD
jgi:hypothetical protein